LGVQFPAQPTPADVQQAAREIQVLTGNRPIEELLSLGKMVDAQKLAIMQVAASITPACYIVGSLLHPLVTALQVNLSLQYGNSLASPFGYACYGIILSIHLQDVTTATEFGRLAQGLVCEPDAKNVRAETLCMIGLFLHHRQSHLRETLPILRAAYQAGLETGNLEFVGYSGHGYCLNALWSGQPLPELEPQIWAYRQQLHDLNQLTIVNYCAIFWEVTLFLGENPDQIELSLEQVAYEEQLVSQSIVSEDATRILVFFLHRAMLRFLFGKVNGAVEDILRARPQLAGIKGEVAEAGFYFYDSLIALSTELTDHQQRVVENQVQLKFWAEHAPMNYLHKWQLVEAEKCRVLGHREQAIDLYDQAIAGAQENGYIQEAALANELAAKFYLSRGKELIAGAYLQEAHYYYQLWGATAKVRDLETRYAPLFTGTATGIKHSRTSSSGVALDLASVVKASQAISEEIMLDKLLSRLMKILIKNAGAQRGCLMLSTQGQLLMEAEGNQEEVTVLQSVPLQNCRSLSPGIINYVARTGESVVLDDATHEGQFTHDSYIREYQPKSVLCVPLMNQGQLISIVYLENNLTIGAFTADRLEVLKLLSSQAAISIQNAKLYTEVRKINQAYERFVPRQFLQFLRKSSIVDVQLGDQVQLEMSVLFADIRDFTALSETMTPEDNFKFINSYLSRMEPVISENYGFIDKYMGDGIMALFSGEADNAVKAGISMLQSLTEYNQYCANSGYAPIKIGIGINTGSLMLGTMGGQNRMDGTVISDAVNLAARVENLTKNYKVPLLITQHTYRRLINSSHYAIRSLDIVKVKGKSELVTVYEVFDTDIPEIKQAKLATKDIFEQGLSFYNQQNFTAASELFAKCLETCASDRAARIYLHRCIKCINTNSDDWIELSDSL
jgi:GAF domain-containing protein